MPAREITAADLYCGAGGSTAGLARACERMGYSLDALAINHWPVAISTHQANQAWARHICWPVDQVDPRRAIPRGRLDLLWASPECTHHSIARGGIPVSDQKRAGAWEVCRWATSLVVDHLIVENVREFTQWGPLTEKRDSRGRIMRAPDGRPLMVPDKARAGDTFRAWLDALRSLGYNVEWRILNCADYGDPTSRQRFFLIGRRGNGRIEWPKATHGVGTGLSPWRTAREIIDWDLRGESIFGRKRPLKPRTIERIAAGLRKFGGANAEPFLVLLYGTGASRSVDRPAPTVTANGQHVGLATPFLVSCNHGSGVNYRVHGVNSPLPTLTASRSLAMVEPFIVRYKGRSMAMDVDRPMPTVVGGQDLAVCQPFLLPHRHAGSWGGGNDPRDVNRPMPTLTCCSSDIGFVQPFLVSYYGHGDAHPISDPLRTVTTKPRFGLVEPARLDILFRMLQPHELAAAQGFDSSYRFSGNKADIVRQIGNAVPPGTAAALCEAVLAA